MSIMDNVGIVILAAGMGKRMKSVKAKVLHEINGRPMIDYVVTTAVGVVGPNVVVVVGHQAQQVKEVVNRSHRVRFALQPEQRGTGHAVLCALPSIPDCVDVVVIMCGDVPLINPATIRQLVNDHLNHYRDVTVLAVEMPDPTGYGRVILDDQGQLTAIVEQADADEEQKNIKLINSGFYVIKRAFLDFALPKLDANNAQNEIYLTDIIGLGYRYQRIIGAMISYDPDEIIGVNSLAELAIAEKLIKTIYYEKS